MMKGSFCGSLSLINQLKDDFKTELPLNAAFEHYWLHTQSFSAQHVYAGLITLNNGSR